MNSRVLAFMLAGVAVIAAGVYLALRANRGERLELTGNIGNVRVHPINEVASFVVIDFRATNISRHAFQVEDITIRLDTAAGELREGSYVSDSEAKRALQQYPLMGPKYNETLTPRTRMAPGETKDWMVAAMFELPAAEVEKRKGLRVRIVERDRRVSEIAEQVQRQ